MSAAEPAEPLADTDDVDAAFDESRLPPPRPLDVILEGHHVLLEHESDKAALLPVRRNGCGRNAAHTAASSRWRHRRVTKAAAAAAERRARCVHALARVRAAPPASAS